MLQHRTQTQAEPTASRSVWSLFQDRTFRQFLSIIGRFKWYYAGAISAQLALTATALMFAEASRRLFDQAPDIPGRTIAWLLVVFMIVFVLQLGLTFVNNWLRSALNESVVYDMRRQVLNHVQRLPLSFHENNHSSTSINILRNELEIAKDFVVFDVQKLITLPISFIIVGLYLLTVHPLLGAIAIIIGPIQLISTLVYRNKFKQALHLQNTVSREVFFTMSEMLQGVREVKANQMEDMIHDRMTDIQRRGVAYNVLLTNVSTIRGIVKDIPSKLGYVAGVGVGMTMMASGQIGAGGLVAFITLLDKVSEPFTVLVDTINNLQRSVSGARRLFEVMDMNGENVTDGTPLPEAAPSIRYDNVSFDYGEKANTLRNISFEVPAGRSIAFVGPSGAGKSTIVKLLYRFYDPISGQISLNGMPLPAYQLHSLRQHMALVSQDIFLFDGNVFDNIAIGRPGASREEVERAAQLAQAHDFITALPDGYDSEIGERGIKLSHGQKQRLSIARAILRNASILVLDEPTSALDVETESSFQSDLGQWATNCTKIIIAHRLSTIREADYILFIDDGAVVEHGTMEQLIAVDGRFRRYWDRQNMTVEAASA